MDRTELHWKLRRATQGLSAFVASALLFLFAVWPGAALADYREGRATVGGYVLSVGLDTDDGSVSVGLESAGSVGGAPPVVVSEADLVEATLRLDCERRVPGIQTWNVVATQGSALLDPGSEYDWALESSARVVDGAMSVELRDTKERLIPTPWRCVSGRVNDTPFAFYFDGYSAFSPALARDAMVDDLATKYPSQVMDRLAYAHCPAMQFFVESGAVCMYQLGRGRSVRAGTYLVRMPKGFRAPVARRSWSARYSQRLTDCPSKYEQAIADFSGSLSSRITAQRLRAPRAQCGASYLWDLPLSATRSVRLGKRTFLGWTHGTNTGGFDAMNIYRCRVRTSRVAGARRYRVRCANRLGDRSTYAFTVRAKRRAAPKRTGGGGSGGSGGGSSGGSGERYAGMTCEEIGHSYPVTPGTDREHDADGDGIACEAQG